MKSYRKAFIVLLLSVAVLFIFSCSPNTGKNVEDGCGTWSKTKTEDTTQINKGI